MTELTELDKLTQQDMADHKAAVLRVANAMNLAHIKHTGDSMSILLTVILAEAAIAACQSATD